MLSPDDRATHHEAGSVLRCAVRIADAAIRVQSLEELGAKIHRIIFSEIPARNAYLALLDSENGLIHFPYWADAHDPAPLMQIPGFGITEYILHKGEPLFADSQTLDTLAKEGAFQILGSRPREWFGVPLKRRGESIGVFTIQAYEGDPPLETQHARLLANIAGVITTAVLALRNAQTHDRRDAMLNAAADAAEIFLRDFVWSRHMDTVLALIGRAANASRAYLFSVDPSDHGPITVSQKFEWVADGIEPQLNNPELQHFDLAGGGMTRWIEKLQRGESISGPLHLFPSEERPPLEAQGILSLHIAPIHVEGHWWGFLGYDDCRCTRVWSNAEREALRLTAQVLGQAIHRERVDAQAHLKGTALRAAANGIVITDTQGRILWVNDAFCRMTGYSPEEVLSRTPAILNSGQHDSSFYRTMWETIRTGNVWQGEIVNRRKDGGLYTEEMTITPLRDPAGKLTHFIAIKQDVTERNNLRRQLLHAQKMESIGRLAGGIAHDFNNLLQAITGFSAILLSEIAETDPRRLDVMEIDRAAHRAAGLTRQLLTFSRRQKMELVSIQLNDIVRGAERMLRRLLPENIAIELHLDDTLPPLRADAGQIEQILVNLVINSRDAMPDGGRLRIASSRIHYAPNAIPPVDGARAGHFAVLSVEDSGRGMSADIIERIFEPFFTTKESGQGTGLGLPVVYGIVRQHDGFILVSSELGIGTTIRIHLPIDETARQTVVAPPIASREGANKNRLFGAGERILVVEDEASVRELTQRVLTNNGYRVTIASTIKEAKALLRAPATPFELLFSDVVLPDGNGLDLAEQARRDHPGLKVILTSGYTQERERWSERIAALDGFLPKPYPPPVLLRALRAALSPTAS